MERWKFTREFKLEAVRLIKERGVSYAQASHDLSVHQTQLRSWVKALADDPRHAFPGQGQMKPEQLEIAQLQREVIKLKAERDILKKPRPTSRRNRREVRLHREAPGDLAGGMVVRGARCLAGWLLCLADTTAQSAQPGQ
jgi:transposase-like protein